MSIYGKMKASGRLACIFGAVLGFAGVQGALAQLGPEPGCFTRTYTAAHLKAQPDQVVAAMKLLIFDQGGGRYAKMSVLFANQGHVRRDGHGPQVLDQFLLCYDNADGPPTCSVECDGGSMRVTRQSKTGLTFETDYLMVGSSDECGGMIDLAEKPRQLVKYRLTRVGPQMCVGM